MKKFGDERFINRIELCDLMPTIAKDLIQELTEYIHFDGFVNNVNSSIGLYVSGFVLPLSEIKDDRFPFEEVAKVELTVYCNNPEMSGLIYDLKQKLIDGPDIDYTVDDYYSSDDTPLQPSNDPLESYYRAEEVDEICKKNNIPKVVGLGLKSNDNLNKNMDVVATKGHNSYRKVIYTLSKFITNKDNPTAGEVITSVRSTGEEFPVSEKTLREYLKEK